MRHAPMRPVISMRTKKSALPTTALSTAKGQTRPSKIPLKAGSIRKRLAALYRGTGRYPDVLWTWNPRYYGVLKTRIDYEAYPESQSEVDALMSKFHFGRVLYDP